MIQKIILLIFFTIMVSCSKKENITPNKPDLSYFPLNVGQEFIYSVEKIRIDQPIDIYDTQRYYLKERIESSYLDETGNIIFRIERYQRKDTSSAWEIKDVWMAQYLNNQAHKVEENIRYVKLIFPVKKNAKWDGNAYNTLEKQIYQIENTDIQWNSYNSTCLVVQQNKESLVDKYYQTERYAKNIGLVEKIDIQISQAFILHGVPIEQRIRRGTIYKQLLIN